MFSEDISFQGNLHAPKQATWSNIFRRFLPHHDAVDALGDVGGDARNWCTQPHQLPALSDKVVNLVPNKWSYPKGHGFALKHTNRGEGQHWPILRKKLRLMTVRTCEGRTTCDPWRSSLRWLFPSCGSDLSGRTADETDHTGKRTRWVKWAIIKKSEVGQKRRCWVMGGRYPPLVVKFSQQETCLLQRRRCSRPVPAGGRLWRKVVGKGEQPSRDLGGGGSVEFFWGWFSRFSRVSRFFRVLLVPPATSCSASGRWRRPTLASFASSTRWCETCPSTW